MSPKGVATIFFKRRDFILLVIPVDLVLVIQTIRSREVLSQRTVLPADDAFGRKRSGNVPVVEVVVVSGEKASSLDPLRLSTLYQGSFIEIALLKSRFHSK